MAIPSSHGANLGNLGNECLLSPDSVREGHVGEIIKNILGTKMNISRKSECARTQLEKLDQGSSKFEEEREARTRMFTVPSSREIGYSTR